MKREIRKMYTIAIIKIIFAIAFGILLAAVLIVQADEFSTAGVIICAVL